MFFIIIKINISLQNLKTNVGKSMIDSLNTLNIILIGAYSSLIALHGKHKTYLTRCYAA